MPAPTPRNPKGAGRKPSPQPKQTASFRPTTENAEKLETFSNYQFKNKSDLINYALRMFFDTYKNPNDDQPSRSLEYHTPAIAPTSKPQPPTKKQ